jgi:hypothetical protein
MHDREEKRREARVKVQGSVDLYWEDGIAPMALHGELFDLSRNGFRALHHGTALLKGQVVQFRHAHAGGKAIVVWNRIAAGVTETGFLIV